MNHKALLAALVTAGLLSAGTAQAALNDRGGGLLYDDVLNVTWLQDANFAKTSGYSTDGLMTWAGAQTWADQLVYHDSVRNVDYSDWRLASVAPVGATWNADFAFNGSTDSGYNITSPNSELSYMYYVNLKLKGVYSVTNVSQSDFGVFANGTWGGQANVGPVKNLQAAPYWSGTAFAADPTEMAWRFDNSFGLQDYDFQDNRFHGWAVRAGDVAAVPEPETYALLLAGMGLVGIAGRRRRTCCH